MARIHGEEGRLGHVGAHRPGVVGGDAGRAQLLQEDRLEVDEMEERAGDVHHRLAGADPLALAVAQVELDQVLRDRPDVFSHSSASRGANTTGRRMKMA